MLTVGREPFQGRHRGREGYQETLPRNLKVSSDPLVTIQHVLNCGALFGIQDAILEPEGAQKPQISFSYALTFERKMLCPSLLISYPSLFPLWEPLSTLLPVYEQGKAAATTAAVAVETAAVVTASSVARRGSTAATAVVTVEMAAVVTVSNVARRHRRGGGR